MAGLRDRLTALRSGFKDKAPGLHRFLTRGDAPYPLVRDLLGIGLVLLLMVTVLWTATGQDFPNEAPVVVVESGSMMHCANGIGIYDGRCDHQRYGRVGTIDPGDLIFVADAPTDTAGVQREVDTWIAAGTDRYGEDGDVIVFNQNGRGGTPIIHRAMLWLEVHGDGTFSVPEAGLEGIRPTTDGSGHKWLGPEHFGIDRQEARIDGNCRIPVPDGMGPEDSGYITKGDNNRCFDQGAGFLPVRAEWVMGKARGELPWIGLIKLGFGDALGSTQHYAAAPGDLKVMMWGVVAVVVGGPFVTERVLRRFGNREDEEEDA